MTQKKIDTVRKKLGGFPEELRYRLLHIILAHHGELSKGSPVEPHTLEAQIIHFLDYLDARQWMLKEAEKHPAQPGSHWSEYSRPLRKAIFIGFSEETSEEDEEGGLF
jgi:3'-5' exoribonuclease